MTNRITRREIIFFRRCLSVCQFCNWLYSLKTVFTVYYNTNSPYIDGNNICHGIRGSVTVGFSKSYNINMKTVLVTAFEPFGGMTDNPSLSTMKSLPDSVSDFRVVKAAVPVSGREIGVKMLQLMNECRPAAVLSFGLAAGETAVRVERFALNVMDYGIKDNSGDIPAGEKIAVDGPAAYFTNTDPAALAVAVLARGVPAYVSNHAGTYVCNTLMYEAMRAIRMKHTAVKFAFVHLPLSTENVMSSVKTGKFPPSLPQAALNSAAAAVLDCLVSGLGNQI